MKINKQIRAGDVQSIHRALDVLECVGRAGELGTSDISRELDLAVSTTHNIVRTLAGRGYLLRSDAGYRLGPGVTVLASQWDPVPSLAPVLKPELRSLAQSSGHAATATVVVGQDAWRIGFEPAPGLVTASSGKGGPTNPLALATGRIIVAMTRKPDWPEFVANAGDIESQWSKERWQQEFQRIAGTGVAVKSTSDDRSQVSTTAIGVPVWGPAESVICSIGCSSAGRLRSVELAQILDALWAATATLSAKLGSDVPIPKPAVPTRR